MEVAVTINRVDVERMVKQTLSELLPLIIGDLTESPVLGNGDADFSRRATPKIGESSGRNPSDQSVKRAGINFRDVRSPDAPKIRIE